MLRFQTMKQVQRLKSLFIIFGDWRFRYFYVLLYSKIKDKYS